MVALMVHEVYDNAVKKETDDEIAAELVRTQTRASVEILAYNFQDRFKFLLPEGRAPMPANDNPPPGLEHSNLNYEMKKMYLFYEGGADDLNQTKREMLYVALLETINPKEAEILDYMKDHKLTELYPKLTQEVCHKAFPEVVPKPTPIKELLRDDKGRFAKKTKKTTKKGTKK